tara:strand:+ start:1139 stop:2185 length:1047 start_codon:yes stop_codon:yes gene_type:complete
MHKGIFSIPVYDQSTSFEKVLDEVISFAVQADKLNFNEAFFGEHIADMHEKIPSSLMMISTLSNLTKNIKLGTLTTNLNFYNPSVLASLISMADNLSKGRLILGIGSGANKSDLEALGFLDKKNYEIMLETYELIKKILNSVDLINFKSENFTLSTTKTGNQKLGLGYFNKLYKDRKNLEIIMPALNENSYNVKLCAKNSWSIAISNFCCEKIVENHIESYIQNSNLNKVDALKKIRLTKLIHVVENESDVTKYCLNDSSPYIKVIDILFTKLKTFKRHAIFGENVNNLKDAVSNTLLAGTPDKITNYLNRIKEKYGELGSCIFVTVPKTNLKQYDNSLELFSKNVEI